MKHSFGILSLLLALVFSCSKPEPEPVVVGPEPLPFEFDGNLLAIDSLLQTDADSALMILLSLDKACLLPTGCDDLASRTANACVGALLLSEALYKTYNPQDGLVETHGRASLQTAMRYFDSLAQRYPNNDDIIMFSARAHYMNGVGFYENDSVIEACEEYLKVLEIMENHFDVEKLTGHKAKFMALTYGRLGDLFSDQFMVAPAIDCGKKTLYYCRIEPTSKYGMANTLSMIGKQFHEIDVKDSALYYYKQALQSLPDYDNSQYRGIISILKLLDYQMGEKPDIALDSLKVMVTKTDNYDEKLTRYLTIGCIYYEEKRYDSALLYLEKVYNDNDDFLSKMQAAEYLREIYRNQGDTITSNRLSKVLADNTMKEYNQKAKTSNVNELYQQHLKHQENKKFQREKHIAKKRTALTTIPIALLLVVTVFIVMRKLGKKHIAQHKEALERTENSLSEIKMKVEVKQFTDEQICQTILDIVKEQQFKSKIDYINYKDYALGNEQLIELRAAVNLHYDNFTIRLKDKFPELTNDDIDYCCLYLLGLKDADVSALMQKEYSNVCRRNRKIRTILKSNNNITESLYNLASL